MFSAVLVISGAKFAAAQITTGTPPPDVSPLKPISPEPLPVPKNYVVNLNEMPTNQRVGVNSADALPLTLEEAVALALQNNNDIEAAKLNVETAQFRLENAQSVYDPQIVFDSFYERRTTPVASTIGGAGATGKITQSSFVGNAGLTGFSPRYGGNYDVTFNNSRTTTGNRNATLNPQYPTALSATFTQPLLRGFRFDIRRRNIEIARKNLSLTDAQFRQNVIEIIAQVEQRYWDLVYSLRNLQNQIDAVRQARLQLESNQRLVDKGALAPIEVVASATQVTSFEQNAYNAQISVASAENALKTLILRDRVSPVWFRPLTPVTPVNLTIPVEDVGLAAVEALQNRPEINQLRVNAEINEIEQRFLRDQSKPQIDLVANYTSQGLAGANNPVTTTSTVNATTQTIIDRVNQLSLQANLPPLTINPTTTTNNAPSNLVGGYFNSLGNLLTQDFPAFRVGVSIAVPLKNRAAKAQYGEALVEQRRIESQRRRAELEIEADVRNTLQAVRSNDSKLKSATLARESAEQQYESEIRQFRAGTTSNFLVLQRQTELINARGRELQAQTDLSKAISQYQRAIGTTLSVNNVSITTDGKNPSTLIKSSDNVRLGAAREFLEISSEKNGDAESSAEIEEKADSEPK